MKISYKNKNIQRWLLALSFIGLTMVQPMGGDKDDIPPMIWKAFP